MNLHPFEQGRSLRSQLTARRLNDIQRSIPKVQYNGGGARVSHLGGQTFVQVPRPRPSSGTPKAFTPFEIFATKNMVGLPPIWDGTYNVTLYPGTVNLLLPSNIFNTINQAIASTQYVILNCISDGLAITSSSWDIESSAPTPLDAVADSPPASAQILLGVIVYNAITDTIQIFQIITDNIDLTPTEWIRVPRPGAGPFELAYQIYYYWRQS